MTRISPIQFSFLFSFFLLLGGNAWSQKFIALQGKISGETKPLPSASVSIGGQSVLSDSNGIYGLSNLKPGTYKIRVSNVGYETIFREIIITEGQKVILNFKLEQALVSLSEVVVTGVSKATLIRESPVSIAVVSSQTIDRTIEPNIIDALAKNVPGLNVVKTGPNISKPFIRGLGYNRVLTLYDGIRQEGQQWGDEHGIEVDAYNIEKAEVIKGPASLMFGSDAVAGVVSLFPYMPKNGDGKIQGRMLSEYQSNNGLFGIGMRLGCSDKHWLWIVTASDRDAKNYTNGIDGRVYNTGFKEFNVAATVGYNSQNGFTTLNTTLYDNLQGIPDGSRDSITRQFTYQINEGPQDDIRGRPLVTNAVLNSYSLSPLHQHIQHYRIYTNNHYRLGKGELDATVNFQQNIRREYNHPTAYDQAGLFVRLNTVNYSIRYLLPVFHDLELTLGANGMYQHNKSGDATDFPIPDYDLKDIGAYLFGKWKYKKLTMSGGLRFDLRQVKINDFYVLTDPATNFKRQVYIPDTIGAALQFPKFNKSFNGISWSIGATYQFSKSISLKTNIARGYRSPNITELSSNGLDPGAHIIYLGNTNFVPEFSLEEDLGLNGDFQNASVYFSIFNNNVQHYIYLNQLVDASGNPVTDAQGNKTFQYEQAAGRIYGAEASLSIHPGKWPGFSFDNTLAVTYGINKNPSYKFKGVDGEWLPLIPPARWISSITQEFRTTSRHFSSIMAKAEAEFNAAQNHYLGLYNTETATPSYTLINLAAGASLKYYKNNLLQLRLQVNNLMNLAYQNNLSRLKYFEYYAASSSGHLGIYNMGRNICLKLIIAF
ncbi:MAG: TonB-dependent receptor [Chitinophagales bacterium]